MNGLLYSYVAHYAMLTCEIELFWNNFSVLFHTSEIISKLFQRHWTCSKISWAAI